MKAYRSIEVCQEIHLQLHSAENYIARDIVSNEIISCFTDENPFTQTYIIVGVRGMGKTVSRDI